MYLSIFYLFIYLFICIFRKYMFCVQLYGKLARGGGGGL